MRRNNRHTRNVLSLLCAIMLVISCATVSVYANASSLEETASDPVIAAAHDLDEAAAVPETREVGTVPEEQESIKKEAQEEQPEQPVEEQEVQPTEQAEQPEEQPNEEPAEQSDELQEEQPEQPVEEQEAQPTEQAEQPEEQPNEEPAEQSDELQEEQPSEESAEQSAEQSDGEPEEAQPSWTLQYPTSIAVPYGADELTLNIAKAAEIENLGEKTIYLTIRCDCVFTGKSGEMPVVLYVDGVPVTPGEEAVYGTVTASDASYRKVTLAFTDDGWNALSSGSYSMAISYHSYAE